MALMEYCLVNILLGDTDAPKPPEPPKLDPTWDLRVRTKQVSIQSQVQYTQLHIKLLLTFVYF